MRFFVSPQVTNLSKKKQLPFSVQPYSGLPFSPLQVNTVSWVCISKAIKQLGCLLRDGSLKKALDAPSAACSSLPSSSRGEQLRPSTVQISLAGGLLWWWRIGSSLKAKWIFYLSPFRDTECVSVAICLLLHLKCYIKILNLFFLFFFSFFFNPTLICGIPQRSNLPGNTLDFPGLQPRMLCAQGDKVLEDVEKTSELPVSVYKLDRCPSFLS